jgi:hypothetical protein
MRRIHGKAIWAILVATAAIPAWPNCAFSQGTSGPIVSDSKTGYIDGAIPGNVFRLRYDTSYNNRRPTRAEFIEPQSAPGGPGWPLPEKSVDYQDVFAYAEFLFLPRLSGFVEVPARFLNPEVNANTAGLGDMNVGFKYAFLESETGLLTFQFRTYIPTGDADRGLGVHHVSLEPALLFYQALSDRAGMEGELRYWVPIGGTDFAGSMVRYGVGFHYDVVRNCDCRLGPVVEFVGWSVLSGKESAAEPSGLVIVRDAGGQTIVNAKLGMRLGISDWADVYAGWGRPLTGDRWYENTFRMEMRFLY